MAASPFILADRVRVEQFSLLGRTRRPFHDAAVHVDADGVAWAVARLGPYAAAVTWLGNGRAFDPFARARPRQADRLAAATAAMHAAGAARHAAELGRVTAGLRLGPRAEPLLWAVHRRVLADRASAVLVPDVW